MSGKEDLLQPGFVERRRHPRVSNAPLGIDKERKGVLVPLQFGTAELPKSQQFPAWQEYMAPVLDCRLPDGADIQNGFIVQQTVWNLGVECPPFRRTNQLLRQCFDELPWGGHFQR
ncbi:hypothetical protein ACNT8L_19985 [Brucella intermedia]|uniref:hypothetical protein n=1 Tax=Brucella intermedia TaxID=94625 RepID=UPI003AB3002A